MANFERLPEIKNAIFADDKEHLKNAGRKGGQANAERCKMNEATKIRRAADETLAADEEAKLHQYNEILHAEGEEVADVWWAAFDEGAESAQH